MKKIFAIWIVLLTHYTYSNAQNTLLVKKAAIDSALINGSWVLIPVLPSDTAAGKLPTLMFNVQRHTFAGFNGCNRIAGRFTLQGNTLGFGGHIITTKMFCQGYNEKQFMENLVKTNAYKIEDGILVLMDGVTPLSQWKRSTVVNEL